MTRFDLTDFEWSVIQPLLPNKSRSVPRVDDKDPRPRRCLRPPIHLKLTEGQAHDGRSADDMFESIARGSIPLTDRAYDSNKLSDTMEERGAWANDRAMPHRLDPPALSKWLYRQRNLVERFFNKLKHYRAVATRYDESDDNYLASVKLRIHPYLVAINRQYLLQYTNIRDYRFPGLPCRISRLRIRAADVLASWRSNFARLDQH